MPQQMSAVIFNCLFSIAASDYVNTVSKNIEGRDNLWSTAALLSLCKHMSALVLKQFFLQIKFILFI